MGLMRAAEKYDHAKHVRFSTYSAWWIRQSISRYLSDKRRTIRLPHRKEEMLRRIQLAYHTLTQLHMRQPKIEEIAGEIGVSTEDVEFILSLSHDIISLENVNDGNEYAGVLEFLEDLTYNPEMALIKKSSREATMRVLSLLKDREKHILIYRYQLHGGRRYTLKNISDKMGLSTETIRQIEFKALQKLRSHADDLRGFVEMV
jgi:RNA polymerase primary sigma factor